MAYVQQVCDGYNKKSLMGNWCEERLYPEQPFREVQGKQVNIMSFRQEKKIKELPVLMEQDFRDLSLESKEGQSGKQLVELFLTINS